MRHPLHIESSTDSSQESNTEERLQFTQNCIFVGLHALAGIEGISELLERHEETWLQHLAGLHNERTTRPPKSPEEEIHIASLLWGLLESAENRGSSLYCVESNSSHSGRENLRKLAGLMGIGVNSQPLHFGEIDQDKANRVLSRCRMFEHTGEVHVANLAEQICKYVPLGPRGIGRLPSQLSHNIQDETANTIWMEM